jgi:hypothetical protein
MANKIGMRIYRISVNERGSSKRVPLNHPDLRPSVDTFIARFVAHHATATQHDTLERSWYFEDRSAPNATSINGYIHYGTFGFESNFVDAKTKKKNYRRKVDDVEEIPLFFEFWFPPKSDFGLVAFQSFQGRSCIQIVIQAMKESFERNNPDYVINFFKLQPMDGKSGAFEKAPVRQVRLIKKNADGDVADKYFSSNKSGSIDFEIRIAARRKGSLGALGDIVSSLQSRSGIIVHEGIEFPEAIAEVRVGDGTRKINLIGVGGDAGVIDLSDSVTRGIDGHPTFDSIAREANSLLRDFYGMLLGK